MAIFLEGPDLSGKTTLAKRIAEATGRKYIKETVYGASVFNVMRKHLLMEEDVVVDRSYFSEAIYPMVQKRRSCGLTFEELWYLALFTMRMGGAHLILCPNDEILKMRYGMRGNGQQSLSEILRVAEIYRRIEQLWWMPLEATITVSGMMEEEIVRQAVHFAEAYEGTRKSYDMNIGHGWGSMKTGKILLVGERFNPRGKSRDKTRLPLAARRRQTTAGYLYAMLRAGMIGPRDVHIINAYERDGTPHDGSVIALLQPRAIVALGDKAYLWCAEHSPVPLVAPQNQEKCPHGIPLHRSDHPAYLRRFWSNFAEDFGYSLGKELGTFG